MTRIAELYGLSTGSDLSNRAWSQVISSQVCPFLGRKCLKNRKSNPDLTIGTCTVTYGKESRNVMICPFRLLERRQIFQDCQQLLTLHEAGNELHIVPELEVPGGSIDYCLASVHKKKVVDFVGIELQTLDTTGTVWPERQRFLQEQGITAKKADRMSSKSYGMNWKMTAKTILVQLHHKVGTFEHFSKHLVLVLQDHLLTYMKQNFTFGHLKSARLGDPMHFHSYSLEKVDESFRLELAERLSTDTAGIAKCLGLQAEARVELQAVIAQIEAKLTPQTLLSLDQPPVPVTLAQLAKGGEE